MADSLEAERVVLENWKKERAELDAAIAVLERKIMARGGISAVAAGNGGQIGPDEFFRLSTPEAIKKFLKIVGKPARATTDIIDGLKRGGMNTNYTNVYTALGRLQTKGVVKVGENWGLDEWYPAAPLSVRVKAGLAAAQEASEGIPDEEPEQPVAVNEDDAAANRREANRSSRKNAVAEFIKAHGPSTRSEIINGTGIPEGSFNYCVKDETMFTKGDDGKWRNVE